MIIHTITPGTITHTDKSVWSPVVARQQKLAMIV
jgi:hypothetical protein